MARGPLDTILSMTSYQMLPALESGETSDAGESHAMRWY